MFNALSIRKKFYGFGGLMAAVALIIGAIGYWGISRQGRELDDVVVTSLALRNHLESDMMHDALRADVLGALRAARDNNKEDMAAVKADLADHSQNFRERVAANKGLTLSDDVRAAISEVEPKLDSYISTAESMIALAEKDSPAAEAAYPPFLANFEELEEFDGQAERPDRRVRPIRQRIRAGHREPCRKRPGRRAADRHRHPGRTDLRHGARHLHAAGCDDRRHGHARRRRHFGRDPGAGPQGRDRQHGRRHAGVQGQRRPRRADGRRAARGAGSQAAAHRDAGAPHRHVRQQRQQRPQDRHRRHQRDAGERCFLVRDRGADQQAGNRRRRRLGRGDQQRADRGRRDRAALRLDRRDQPPGRPVRRHRQQGRGRGRAHQRPGPQPGRRRPRRSAKW